MSTPRRILSSWRLVLILGMLSAGAAAQENASTEPGFGAHYWKSTKGMAVGGGLGFAFGLAASAGGKEETMAASSSMGLCLGMMLGSAWYANTITHRHEAEGSFGLDLLASFGTTTLAAMMIAGAADAGGDDGAGMLLFIGGMGVIPLGSVVMQRMVAGTSARVEAWHPAGTSPETMGVVVSWGIR